MLERVQWAGSGAAIVSGNKDHIGLGFGNTCSYRSHTKLAHELDVNPGPAVGPLQVENKLLEVLDGVDVVVRRWRNQANTGS